MATRAPRASLDRAARRLLKAVEGSGVRTWPAGSGAEEDDALRRSVPPTPTRGRPPKGRGQRRRDRGAGAGRRRSRVQGYGGVRSGPPPLARAGPGPELLTVAQVGAGLAVGPHVVYDLIRSGELPARQEGACPYQGRTAEVRTMAHRPVPADPRLDRGELRDGSSRPHQAWPVRMSTQLVKRQSAILTWNWGGSHARWEVAVLVENVP